jgi:hypothetical protein
MSMLLVGILSIGGGLLAQQFAADPGDEQPQQAASQKGKVMGEPATKESDGAKEDPLASWPADAPIQLRPRLAESKLNQQAALERVRQYLGIDKAARLQMAPAYLTDNDFPFLRPQKQAIWLARSKRLYIAIDADSGQLIEAFTPPAQPWWRAQEQIIGPAHDKSLRESGETLERPTDAPKITVLDALGGLLEKEEQGQLIVRYALYSNTKSGRIEEGRFVPVAQRRPALIVFREGLHMQSGSPAPGPGTAIIGRSMIVLDALTGAPLCNVASGNPIR